MIKRLFFIITFLFLFFPVPKIHAQDAYQENFYKARVTTILEEGFKEIGGYQNPYQKVELVFTSGPHSGQSRVIDHGGVYSLSNDQRLKSGDQVVVNELSYGTGEVANWIIDRYRVNNLAIIAIFFFILVILISGFKGFGSIIGMIMSFVVIIQFIVPQIMKGNDPVVISVIGSLVIMFTTMYFAHGYSRQTTLAVMATFITLILTGILSHLFVNMAHLTGLGSEDAYSLQLGPTANINLKGLLLGGMILGALGVLDDITTTQTAVIMELYSSNKKLKFHHLVKRGLNVGREHVASLVNTLIMAYAGASLPLFIFFVLNPTNQPLWLIVNSEIIAEEIIRSLSGSAGLVLAVPITTLLVAWHVVKFPPSADTSHRGHHH